MKNSMLYTTDIHIYRQIFISFLFGNQFFIILIIYITEEIPGRSGPLRHGICLTFCRCTTAWACGIYPLVDGSKR